MGIISLVVGWLRAFGVSSIDLFEWQQTDVLRNRLPNDPQWSDYATPRGRLTFSGFRLAHAVVKADFLILRNFVLPSVGFLLQMDGILAFGTGSGLRLAPGASNALSDVTHSSVTGRVGQGLSILFAMNQGYSLVGHLASEPQVIARRSIPGFTRAADFMFEKRHGGSRMILESKCSFNLDANDPTKIKRALKGALSNQVLPWLSALTPAPQKGYAVYSCLREIHSATPSALVFVDPPGAPTDDALPVPGGWMWRRNYGGWLKAMGLFGAGRRLTGEASEERSEVALYVADVGGREFAVQVAPKQIESDKFLVMGLDRKVLAAVARAADKNSTSLSYHPKEYGLESESEDLSIFPDGSLFGLLSAKSINGLELFRL